MSPPGGAPAASPQARQAARPANTAPPARASGEELLVSAYRLRSLGWTEQAALLFLHDVTRTSGGRAGKRIRRMSDELLARHLAKYERDRRRAAGRNRRGDLITIRSSPRWPWRIAT